MAVPVWNVGQVLTAPDVNTWFVPLAAQKPADTSRASTTTPASDPDLTLSLAASATYEVWFSVYYACAAAGVNLSSQFTVPSGALGQYDPLYWSGATTWESGGPNTWPQNRLPYIGTGQDWAMSGHGVITTTGAGTFAFQWAQSNSSATAVVMRKYSLLTARRIG